LAAGLLCAGGAVAQVVQVPAGCVVRVAGVGGNIGAGLVGDGGIVEMNEPFAAGTFTFSEPAAQCQGWTLLGDINRAPLSAPVAFGSNTNIPAGANAASLGSWNKNLRPSEVASPSTNARSKGRVTIRWDDGVCGRIMSFDVLKRWGGFLITSPPPFGSTQYAPPIVGPNCWGTPPFVAPNDKITFSVDQVSSDNQLDAIGSDQYYWEVRKASGTPPLILPLLPSYTSADRSSLTIDQDDPAFTIWYQAGTQGPYTIKVCYGQCNPWNGGASATSLAQLTAGVTCVQKQIQAPCPVPAFSGGFPSCINAITPGVPLTITPTLASYNAACTYNWTRSNLSWSISNAVNGAVTISAIGDANPCTFFLTVSSASCGSTVYTYTVNRNYNNAAILAALTPYCASSGTFTVNLAPNAQGNQTCWSGLPVGWSAVNPVGNLSAVQFTIPAAAAGTTANINLFSCACPGVTLPIVINVRPGAPVITGPLCVLSGGGANQTWNATSAGANATAFNWNNTMGMTQVAPTNDAPGVFTPNGTADGNVSVFTQNVVGCPSTTTTFNVGRNAVAPVVVAPTCYNLGYSCAGVAGLPGTASFTIQPANFTLNGPGNYTWTFPPNTFFNPTGSTFVVGPQFTNAPIVRPTTGVPSTSIPAPAASYYQYSVCFTPSPVFPNLASCVSACTTFTATGVTLNEPLYTPAGAIGFLAPAPGTPAGSTYLAYDCAIPGTYGSSVAFPNAINLAAPALPPAPQTFSLTMQITVPGGCTWLPAPVATTHKSLTVVNESGVVLTPAEQVELGILVSPNPNDGAFTLNLKQEFLSGSVQLLDAAGKQAAAAQRVVQGNNEMRYSDLPPGVYILRIELDGQVQMQRIVVSEGK